MAGPTTEVLNEDIKELRHDILDLRLEVQKIGTQLDGLLAVAKRSLGTLTVFGLTSLISGVWWAASTGAEVRNLGVQVSELKKLLTPEPPTLPREVRIPGQGPKSAEPEHPLLDKPVERETESVKKTNN
jgi:hypothetical protein